MTVQTNESSITKSNYPLCPKGHVMMTDKLWTSVSPEKWFICKICKFRCKGKTV